MSIRRLIRIVPVVCSLMAMLVANEIVMPASSFGSSTAIPPCRHLLIAAEGSEAALGTGGDIVILANPGAVCEVMGVPTVTFYNNKGSAVTTRNSHFQSMLFSNPAAKAVVLQRSTVASFAISWSNNPVGGTKCLDAAWMQVSLRGGIGSISGSPAIQASPCGGILVVTAIQAGAIPKAA